MTIIWREIAEWTKELDPQWVSERKQEFYRSEIERISKSLQKIYAWYEDAAKRDIDYWFRRAFLEYGKVERAEKRLAWLRRAVADGNSRTDITLQDIERAREHSWENLLEFRKGKAFCPFHNDKKHPNFTVKDGKGRCWACGWSGDSINFVMDRDNLPFREAVKFLGGGR